MKGNIEMMNGEKGLQKTTKRIAIFLSGRSFPTIKWLFRYSGVEFIYRKFNPPKNPQLLPTGFIWLIGIYIAFYGIAAQRYENRVDIIENRANAIFAQLATEAYKNSLSRISAVQNMWCPAKPEILNPFAVFRSLFKATEYQEIVKLLKETIEGWKNKLYFADLYRAKLQGAQLWRARLDNANLMEADLQGADLRGANLRKANLKGANLREANLKGANLREVDFGGAGVYGLTAGRLCEAKSLYNAKLDPETERQIRDMCPHLLEAPQ